MRFSFITLLFLFALQSGFAQKNSAHTIEITEIEPMVVNGFYIDEIIDRRIITDNIGFVQKGMNNKKIKAIFPSPFNQYLKKNIDQIIHDPKGEPIVLLVHEFNITERTTSMSEKGYFRLQFEFAKRVDTSLNALWYVEFEIEESGLDVTKGHRDRIKKGIKLALAGFNTSNWRNEPGEMIEAEIAQSFDFKKGCKKGLYSSFNKLAKNEPFMEEGFQLKEIGNKYPAYKVIDNDGKKIRKRIMFVSDGTHIYMNQSRYSYGANFTRSKLIGKYIYFEDQYSEPMAGVMFGLLGALASNSSKSIVLDSETGLVTVLSQEGKKKIILPHTEITSEYNKSRKRINDVRKAIERINVKYALK